MPSGPRGCRRQRQAGQHDARLDFTDRWRLRASVENLMPGRYMVPPLSADGHVVSGKYFFQIPNKEGFLMIIPHEPCFLRPLSKLVAVAALAVAAGVASAAGVPRDNSNGRQMYQGASMSCLVANDFYAVHFTALQEGRHEGEQTDFVKYCQEVPRPGKTYLTLDLLDRDARSMPVSLRVVEEELGDDGRPPKEKRTLVETPATVYKSGTAEIQADITEPGHYAVIAVFGENDGFISE